MSGTDTDPESTVATVQDPPTIEPGAGSSAGAAPAENRTASETSAEPQAPTGRAGRLSPMTRRLVPITLAVLVSASATAVALLGWDAIRAGNAEQNAAAALDTARTGTSQVFTYESATLDADLARARAHLAEPFATLFEQRASSVIVPASQQQAVSARGEIIRSALIDSQPERAEALLTLRRTASSATQPQPTQEVIDIKVTMTTNSDGQWMISEMQLL